MNISVFGLGYVGAVSCACLTERGHRIIGVDTNPTKVDLINRGQSPVVEDQIDELMAEAKVLGAPFELVKEVHDTGKLPVVNFAAGGVATPSDAALMMQLGSEGVFVGSGIFKSENPAKVANAIVQAVTHYKDAKLIGEVSKGLGDPMSGMDIRTLPETAQLARRGW